MLCVCLPAIHTTCVFVCAHPHARTACCTWQSRRIQTSKTRGATNISLSLSLQMTMLPLMGVATGDMWGADSDSLITGVGAPGGVDPASGTQENERARQARVT